MHVSWPDAVGLVVPSDIAERLRPLQQWRVVLPVEVAGPRTLWHAACTHRNYNLTCEQFEDDLLAFAGYACQRCGEATDRFHIDHDHALGDWAVRGLLCPSCNALLGRIENGRAPMDDLSAEFLRNPYPHRRPYSSRPVYGLRRLIEMRYSIDHDTAARKAKWRLDRVDLMKRAAICRTAKFKTWNEKWVRESGAYRLLDLMEEIDRNYERIVSGQVIDAEPLVINEGQAVHLVTPRSVRLHYSRRADGWTPVAADVTGKYLNDAGKATKRPKRVPFLPHREAQMPEWLALFIAEQMPTNEELTGR